MQAPGVRAPAAGPPSPGFVVTLPEPHYVQMHAGQADLLACVADEVFDDRIDPRWLHELLGDESHVLIVACIGPQVVGQITAVRHRHPDAAPDLYIENLGVAPACRRRGIARELIRRMRAVARAMDCREVWLATESDNAAARALYARTGAREQPVLLLSLGVDGVAEDAT